MADGLVVQVIKLLTDGEDVLRLLRNHVLAFTIGGIEDGGESLGHWPRLRPRLLGPHIAILGAFGVSTGG